MSLIRSANKKRSICIFAISAMAVAIAVILIFALNRLLADRRADRAELDEHGSVSYTVTLKENEFFGKEELAGGEAYVGELIESICTEFGYSVRSDRELDGEYFYSIEAMLQIRDKSSDAILLERTDTVVKATSVTPVGKEGLHNCAVNIDYNKYNDVAKDFISRYSLNNTESAVTFRMNVDISELGMQADISDASAYEVEITVPLAESTVRPTTSHSEFSAEPRVLSYESEKGASVALIIALTIVQIATLAALAIVVLAGRSSKNEYRRRVDKALSDYKNYVQKTKNLFDAGDRQILYIDSLNDMLEIRDTLQIPILVHEDEENMRASFFIIASSEIVYLFEMNGVEECCREGFLGAIEKRVRALFND